MSSKMELENFQTYLLEDGKVLYTAKHYTSLLRSFLKDHKFNDDECRKFLLEKQLTKSASCRNKYVKVFKQYGKFKHLDFTQKFKEIAEHPEEYDRLTAGELWDVIEAVPFPDRMSVLLLTIANTGARVNEVLSAKKKHLTFRMIRIKSKTQEIRKIALHQFTYDKILEYLQTSNIDSEYLFPNYLGKRMTSAGVLKEYRRRLKLCNINKHTRVHDIRHSYMNRQHKNNPLRVLQEQVGHKKLETTQKYTHPDEEDLLLLASRDTLFAENIDPTEQLSELIEEARKRGLLKDPRFKWKIANDAFSVEIQTET